MVKKFLPSMFFILLSAAAAMAQSSGATPRGIGPPPRARIPDSSKRDEQDLAFPEDIRIKMAIERADNEYRKTLEDADKLNDMSSEVAKSFRDNGKLSADELKKVGSIEKLAKRILSQAGGDEVDDKDKSAHRSVSEAVEQMSAAAANIQKNMKTQTRFVVSATVIANSNEVINLAQFIRHSLKSD
ncbi:MAG TPA: hypothetical protein VJZ26_11365 [Blastocatellia bacterium]|nr:hypothetical protein [Blastocatellia bacterium]